MESHLNQLDEVSHLREDPQWGKSAPFYYPSLLEAPVQEAIATELSGCHQEVQEHYGPILAWLRQTREDLIARRIAYDVGFGPVGRLIASWRQGECSRQQALAQAAGEDFQREVSPVYLRAVAGQQLDEAQEGRWREPLEEMPFTLAALPGTPVGEDWNKTVRRVWLCWFQLVQCVLCEWADGRLYRRTMAEGEKRLQEARASGDRAYLADLLFRLGVMHLDPYTAARSSANARDELARWQRRFMLEVGNDLAGVPREQWEMPRPEVALAKARDFLEQAAAIPEAEDRASALKALIQTLEWRGVYGQEVDAARVKALCPETLALLDPLAQPTAYFFVLGSMQRHDIPVILAQVEPLLAVSLDAWLERHGPRRTVELTALCLNVLITLDPWRAWQFAGERRSLLALEGDEYARITHFGLETRLLRGMFSLQTIGAPDRDDFPGWVGRLRGNFHGEGWDARRQAAASIVAAMATPSFDQEPTGLLLLQEATELAPVFARSMEESLRHLKTTLRFGIAVNAVHREDRPEAVRGYGAALADYLEMNLPQAALDCLVKIEDLTRQNQNDPALTRQSVGAVFTEALRLESVLGSPAVDLIQRICKYCIAATPDLGNAAMFLLQVAKGLRFGTALCTGARYALEGDTTGQAILAAVDREYTAVVREDAAAGPADAPPAKPVLDEETILSAFYGPEGAEPGPSPRERLAFFQRRFETHLEQQTLGRIPNGEPIYLSLDEVRSALDERTVLLQYYMGRAADGQVAVYVLLLTREGEPQITSIKHPFPDAALFLGGDGQEIQVSPVAMLVAPLRTAVQDWPGARVASEAAVTQLQEGLRMYLGWFPERLAELRKSGKDHLCIVPHGALHYLPFHLLGEENKPLAEEWGVTYLPSLHLLIGQRGKPVIRRHRGQTLAAFGLGFGDYNPHGLTPDLPSAPDEARKVAEVFGVEAFIDAQATEKRFDEALNTARYIHLATHGEQNAMAPAFHTVYLAPDDKDDGKMHAYEIQAMDLRGLELVTFSACETALGRFDIGDNLRGLPASLFLAGVETFVGTLWSVEDECSATFFTALYESLKAGCNRLDAFVAAQRKTRHLHPKYKDWGAFYMSGYWG